MILDWTFSSLAAVVFYSSTVIEKLDGDPFNMFRKIEESLKVSILKKMILNT